MKTTERGGVRGFDAHKRVKGRKRHIFVNTLGLPFASRVEAASTSDRVAGSSLQIVKRRGRAFRITGLTPIVERFIAWLNRNRRLAGDYEYRVQSSETMLDIAAIRLMLNRLAPA